jgi:pimeloyl-ACP methyl ester carboxylesterase
MHDQRGINMRSFQKDPGNDMALEEADLSFLDRHDILKRVFHPRTSNIKPLAPNARNHFIEVEKGIKIGCRYYAVGKNHPSLLYFHGNAMIVDDMDLFAPLFNEAGVNLFVSSYRGYGLSNGIPTVTSMFKDSHLMFEGFKKTVEDYGFRRSYFLMGYSLGSLSAIQLAYNHQDDIKGLIVESGSAESLKKYFIRAVPQNHPIWRNDSAFLNKVKLRSISRPTLIIHGEQDSLIPVDEARELYENSAALDKRLVIIPNAGHNNLFIVAREQYHKAVKDFVEDYG